MIETRRVRVWISGRVQGVGFRAYTQAKGRELGLRGWVRNLEDRRVEALFEGDAASVDEMLRWCWEGSPYGRVESVESRVEEPLVELPPGFEIHY